jgi:N-acetylmuramate 1-kinase
MGMRAIIYGLIIMIVLTAAAHSGGIIDTASNVKVPTSDMTVSDARTDLIQDWLRRDLGWPQLTLEPASADASFRRYFRVRGRDGATHIVMDAPPEHEDVEPYLRVSRMLAGCGVHVPHVDAADTVRGLVLLEDLGSEHYLARLGSGGDADALYADALEALARIQVHGREAAAQLAPYDRVALERELGLMPEWFAARHLQLALDESDRAVIGEAFEFLVREALAQPRVFVHRDYHSRNLMLLPVANPGVIDFQDALAGPVGYDLVSLLKDCYIAWPRAQVEHWLERYRLRLAALDAGVAAGADAGQFLRWFDLIGVQRHLKVLGIFARLWYRDGKPGYLADLPRTLEYVLDTVWRYPELAQFGRWLDARVLPRFAAANAREPAAAGAIAGMTSQVTA